MALFEGKTSAERYKTIAAFVLGAIALIVVARWLFFSSKPTSNKAQTNVNRRQTPARATPQSQNSLSTNETDPSLIPPTPVVYFPSEPNAPAPTRNIFAFYVPPVRTPTNANSNLTPPATPAPTPPLMLASLAPTNVYAQTGDFALQISGDKFTPESRIYVENQELPTNFTSAQQLQTNVPAALIASAGARQVMVRTPDGQLFSNTATLNVAQPPAPPYTFIGVLIKRGNDVAILKDQKGDLINAQRGDLLNGRFRVTSISERAVEFVDAELKIKHTLPYSDPHTATGNNPPPPPTRISPQPVQKKSDEDEEDSEPEP